MRFGVFYSAPPFGFPVSFLFPARTFFRLLSLFCAHIGPVLSVHVHSYTRPRSEVAQVVIIFCENRESHQRYSHQSSPILVTN